MRWCLVSIFLGGPSDGNSTLKARCSLEWFESELLRCDDVWLLRVFLKPSCYYLATLPIAGMRFIANSFFAALRKMNLAVFHSFGKEWFCINQVGWNSYDTFQSSVGEIIATWCLARFHSSYFISDSFGGRMPAILDSLVETCLLTYSRLIRFSRLIGFGFHLLGTGLVFSVVPCCQKTLGAFSGSVYNYSFGPCMRACLVSVIPSAVSSTSCALHPLWKWLLSAALTSLLSSFSFSFTWPDDV